MTQSDQRQLRDAFGAFMTGVTVVTSHNLQGQPIGFTANSFTSVSLDPPLLLISLAKTSGNHAAMTAASGFAVNILSEDQESVSNNFARPVEDRFAAVEWSQGSHGAPILTQVAAWFDCSMHQVVDAGDHTLLIGRIEAFDNIGLNGLGYVRGSYFRPSLEGQGAEALRSGSGIRIGAVLEWQGQILLEEKGDGGLDLPSVLLDGSNRKTSHQQHLVNVMGPSVSVGFVYSVYEDVGRGTHNIIYHCTSTQGEQLCGLFCPIDDMPMDRIADPATRDILKRYIREQAIGDFGIYTGNEQSGHVRQLARGT
ncbi:MAG: flavin reductase family protein [Rhizobiaceae bacterium]|nr:flavin reductase family protein [Rhizobiaceae bacterium]